MVPDAFLLPGNEDDGSPIQLSNVLKPSTDSFQQREVADSACFVLLWSAVSMLLALGVELLQWERTGRV
jgi:hypothetical protein